MQRLNPQPRQAESLAATDAGRVQIVILLVMLAALLVFVLFGMMFWMGLVVGGVLLVSLKGLW